MEKPPQPITSDLVAEIKRLQTARQSHLDAIRAIDEILRGVAQTLTASGPDALVRAQVEGASFPPPPSFSAASHNPLLTADFPVGTAVGMTRRRYHRLPQTGEDF